jgi:hypothetical protein
MVYIDTIDAEADKLLAIFRWLGKRPEPAGLGCLKRINKIVILVTSTHGRSRNVNVIDGSGCLKF